MNMFFWGLQLVFITLKLANKINWEWYYVFMPLELLVVYFIILVIVIKKLEAE